MSAIDVIRRRLEESGLPPPTVPKCEKPATVAFVDVVACIACGRCVTDCPADCLQILPEGSVEGRDPQPVQVRYDECVGCHVCIEICAHVVGASAIRSYDSNLVEQVLSTDIGDTAPATVDPPEPWDDYFSEGGGFHHMGEGSRIATLLDGEDLALLAQERPPGSGSR